MKLLSDFYLEYRGNTDNPLINFNEDSLQYFLVISVSLGWSNIPEQIFQDIPEDFTNHYGLEMAPPAVKEKCFNLWLDHISSTSTTSLDQIEVYGIKLIQYVAEQGFYDALSKLDNQLNIDFDTQLASALETSGLFSSYYNNLACYKENDFSRQAISELFHVAKSTGDLDTLSALVDKYHLHEDTHIDASGTILNDYLSSVENYQQIFKPPQASVQHKLQMK